MASGRREFRNVDLARARALHRLGAVLPGVGALRARIPAILDDPVVGEAARNVYAEGQAMLRDIVAGRWLTANGAVALLPANSVGDDIEIYADEARDAGRADVAQPAPAERAAAGQAELLPRRFRRARSRAGVADYLGAFAVTAGLGIERQLAQFEAAKDDYSAIMLKALADRLAEAFAEWLHRKVRRELWGYARGRGARHRAR